MAHRDGRRGRRTQSSELRSLPTAIHRFGDHLYFDLREYADVAHRLRGIPRSLSHVALLTMARKNGRQIDPSWRHPLGQQYRSAARREYAILVEQLEEERSDVAALPPRWDGRSSTVAGFVEEFFRHWSGAKRSPYATWLRDVALYRAALHFGDKPLHRITGGADIHWFYFALRYEGLPSRTDPTPITCRRGDPLAKHLYALRQLYIVASGRVVPEGYNPVSIALQRRRRVTWQTYGRYYMAIDPLPLIEDVENSIADGIQRRRSKRKRAAPNNRLR